MENLSGECSSLAYSMLQASDLLQCPFIFHADDTASERAGRRTSKPEKLITGAKEAGLHLYVSFDHEAGMLTRIHDNGQDLCDYIYQGVFGIEDNPSHWSSLRSEVFGTKSADATIYLDGIKNG